MRIGARAALASGIAAMMASGLSSLPVHAAAPTYSGRAFAVALTGVRIAGTAIPDTYVADTGLIPASGGSQTAGVGTITLPAGLGTVQVLASQAQGQSLSSWSVSRITAVRILPQPVGPDALDISAAEALTGVVPAGKQTLSSGLGSVSVNGATTTIPVGNNTTVTIPGPTPGSVIATITANEIDYVANGNIANAAAAVVNFPAGGVLAAAIVGTLTFASATSGLQAPASGTLPAAVPPAGPPTVTPFTAGLEHPLPLGILGTILISIIGVGLGTVVRRRLRLAPEKKKGG